MKKSLIFLFAFSIILIFPLISSAEITMNSEFDSGETLLAKVSGNFIDQITDDNVFFYRGHSPSVFDFDVFKIEDEFYIYAILTGKTEGNYSLSIEGVEYMKGIQRTDDDIVSNFSISNETAIFSINPGVISTSGDFSVELQNLQDTAIMIEVDIDSSSINSQDSLELKSGEKKILSFNVLDDAEKGFVDIELSSESFLYTLPVYLDTNVTSSPTIREFEMEFQPSRVEVSMATDSETKRIIYLKNTGKETIEDLVFEISPLLEDYVTISPSRISELDPNSTAKIEIEISSGLEEAVIEGKIRASAENSSTSFTILLDFIDNFIPADGEEDDLIILTTCEDLEGIICVEDGQECSGETVNAKDGVCCLAPSQCAVKEQSSYNKKLIGWGLLLLAFAFVYWFYKKKYRGIGKRKPF